MKKKLIKAVLVFCLFGIVLTGCQEKVNTPVENASSDSELTSSNSNSESTESTNHKHDHSHNDEKQKDRSFEEYKEYYKVGYETNIERIVIKDNTMTFYNNGEGKTGEYKYR